MTEPNGQEYILESTQNRTTSIIIRKAPNIVTLMQRTASGLAVIDLGDEVKQAMIDLLAPTQPLSDDGGSLMPLPWPEPQKRRGRPPKAA